MQETFLECDSARLVPFTLSDIKNVQALRADPFGNQCRDSLSVCSEGKAEELIRSSLQNQEELGLAKWKMISVDGDFLGWAGFTPVSETSEISLNYCLAEAAEQGAAFSKRLCAELIKWFFQKTYYSHLVTVVRTDNRDMREVVLDTGFVHRESKVIEGMQADLFQMFSPSMQSYLMTA